MKRAMEIVGLAIAAGALYVAVVDGRRIVGKLSDIVAELRARNAVVSPTVPAPRAAPTLPVDNPRVAVASVDPFPRAPMRPRVKGWVKCEAGSYFDPANGACKLKGYVAPYVEKRDTSR